MVDHYGNIAGGVPRHLPRQTGGRARGLYDPSATDYRALWTDASKTAKMGFGLVWGMEYEFFTNERCADYWRFMNMFGGKLKSTSRQAVDIGLLAMG